MVLLGWLYSNGGVNSSSHDHVTVGIICLSLVIVGCGVILQAIVFYGTAMTYVQHKNEVLNPQFQKLLSLESPPLTAVPNWKRAAASLPVAFAAAALFLFHAIVSAVLLWNAWWRFKNPPGNSGLRAAVLGVAVMLVITLFAEVLMNRALRRVFVKEAGRAV